MPPSKKTTKPKQHFKDIVRSSRVPEIDDDDYKYLLRVDLDWGSTGIWEIPSIGSRLSDGVCSYEMFNLPDWLVDRFNYWTDWYSNCEPWKNQIEADRELHNAYGLSLAIDLKRYLGDTYYIEYHGKEIYDDAAFISSELKKSHSK